MTPSTPQDPNPLDLETEILRELFQLEIDGTSAAFHLGPFSVFILVQLCQMGVTRVGPTDQRAAVFRRVASELEPYFEDTSAGAVLAAAWADIDRAAG